MNEIVSAIDSSQILNYEEQLQSQRYHELPLTKLFGENSGIVIYNDKNAIVFEKGNFQKIPDLSVNDIACIPEYSANTEITVNDMTTQEGKLQRSISIKEQGKNGDMIKTYILDEKNHIIYQPGNLPVEALDNKQVKLLSNTYFDMYSLKKHTFINNDGSCYTMIIFSDALRPETQGVLVRSVWIFLFHAFSFME